MASDRHGKHNKPTIAFRVTPYEQQVINERVKASGMKKQDYIVRSCIYNHVCVVGKRENLEILRSEAREMYTVLEEVSKDIKGQPCLIGAGDGKHDGKISCIFRCNAVDAEGIKIFVGGKRQ